MRHSLGSEERFPGRKAQILVIEVKPELARDHVEHLVLRVVNVQRRRVAVRSERLQGRHADIDVELLRVLTNRDDVAIEVVLRATNTGPLDVGADDPLPPTDRSIELPSVWFLRLGGDGKIVEERDQLDTASFFRQLGLAEDD